MCVSDEKRATIYETLGLINEQLWLGHFELWSNSGLVLFRNGALLGSGETLSLEQAQTLIETALDECERFYPVFQFVLWGGKTPRSEEHTSELQSLMRISYAVFCLKKKNSKLTSQGNQTRMIKNEEHN